MEESSECRVEELSEYRPKVILEEDAEARERTLFWKAMLNRVTDELFLRDQD